MTAYQVEIVLFEFPIVRIVATWTVVLSLSVAGIASAQSDVTVDSSTTVASGLTGSEFGETIAPFLTTYCSDCHGADDPEGMLNLSSFASTADVAGDFATWDLILRRVEAGEMPPQDYGEHPSKENRFLWSAERPNFRLLFSRLADAGAIRRSISSDRERRAKSRAEREVPADRCGFARWQPPQRRPDS